MKTALKAIIIVLGFVCLLGSVGAYDLGNIGFWQFAIQVALCGLAEYLVFRTFK